MNVLITLEPTALEGAINTRIKRGMDVPPNFEGPDFKDIEGVEVNEHAVTVYVPGVTYTYPMRNVACIKEY